ncbi:hypothetical protein BH10BAC3_BH10BAC3_03250 [soil metagenome]
MYQGLLHLHNFMRWVILILLVVNIVRHLVAAKQPFADRDKKFGLMLMIAAHITLLIGLYQYFAGPWGFQLISDKGMAVVMKDSALRFWAVEHITGMLIGIVLITIARGVFRKPISNEAKHKKALLLYIIALVVILASVPWPFREGIARPLFPGM